MGQAKANLSRLIRDRDPICIYCGAAPSMDADHCPPKVIFTGKDRPKGLEFGTCKECHEPTRQIDLIAATYGRLMPAPTTDAERADIRKYAQANLNNNFEVARIFGGPSTLNNAGMHVLRVEGEDGERLHRAMHAFSARLGMALYREIVGRPVDRQAYIFVRYYSSYDLANDTLPPDIFEVLKRPRTLRAGAKDKSREFLYDHAFDGDRFMSFALFRESFATLALISNEPPPADADADHIFRPGFLKGFDWRAI